MGEYHQITISEYMEMKDEIRRELSNQAESFIRTGYYLRQIEDSEAFRQEGYASVYEFAEREFNLSKSTVSRLKAINKEFSEDGYSKLVDPRYRGIGKSILAEMLALPDPDRELVTPETAREDVRELRRFNRDAEGAQAEPETGAGKAFWTMLDKDAEVAERVREVIEAGQTDAEHLAAAVAPSGSKMFRAGAQFLAFKPSGITVKTFGGGQESVDWSEFATAAKAWIERKEREDGAVGGKSDDDGGYYREGEGSPAEMPGGDETLSAENQGNAFEVRDGDRGSNGYSEPDSESGDKEGEPDREPAADEDAGSGRDEETEDGDAGKGQLETGDDADNSSDAEAEPVAEEPEETGMNPPIVEKPEPVAPAQQKPKKTADISKIQPIVDEKGQPAPEEQSLDIRVMRVEASQICRDLSNNIGWRNWKKALECVEMIQPKLRALAFHDK